MAVETVTSKTSVLDQFHSFVVQKPDELFLIDAVNGSYTWSQALDRVRSIAASLQAMLGKSGKRVSILADNSADWILTDLGIMMSGHVSAPLFTSMSADKFEYALTFLDVQVLFLGPAANWEAVKDRVPSGVTIVALPSLEAPLGAISYDEFLAMGKQHASLNQPDIGALCCLILTSGTTGNPKAVMHSLRTLGHIAEAFSKINLQESLPEIRLLCHLPLAHIGEKVTVLQALSMGGNITVSRGPAYFFEDLQAVQPTLALGVPRIWERMLQVAIERFAANADDFVAKLEQDQDQAFRKEVVQFLGLSAATCCISGGALSAPYIKDTFSLLGVEVLDFYGQTEIVPLTSQRPGQRVSGSVGTVAPGFELKIGSDGEVIGRGAAVALGYFNDEANTRKTFREGWVYTGDKGVLDDDGNLFIIGRMQDTFKTAKGKYVAPGPIESLFAALAITEQQVLVGLGLTQPVLVCTLSQGAVGLSDCDIEQGLLEETASINAALEPHERIGAILISRDIWTIESGLITHTQKTVRNKVIELYAEQIAMAGDKLRNGSRDFVAWL
ncbi:AMP-binding protein [Hyphomonas sp. FCG-A18]|uniref:AMP-binding protein n=1 Tax=Hyphomonas sp. FCG-A18 TaxID=3080019 RepID=UPI002B2BEF9C|nr:AMP-binding protein [Hyphomonas sp. FCG-A18]